MRYHYTLYLGTDKIILESELRLMYYLHSCFSTKMKFTSVIVILFVGLFQTSKAECPQVNDLPVYLNSETFFCARFYYGFGNDLDIHACNGCSIQEYYDVADGTGIRLLIHQKYLLLILTQRALNLFEVAFRFLCFIFQIMY